MPIISVLYINWFLIQTKRVLSFKNLKNDKKIWDYILTAYIRIAKEA